MSKITKVELTCPYCKVALFYPIEDVYSPQIILCDNGYGGCDRYFAVEVMMKPVVKYYKMNEIKETV